MEIDCLCLKAFTYLSTENYLKTLKYWGEVSKGCILDKDESNHVLQ